MSVLFNVCEFWNRGLVRTYHLDSLMQLCTIWIVWCNYAHTLHVDDAQASSCRKKVGWGVAPPLKKRYLYFLIHSCIYLYENNLTTTYNVQPILFLFGHTTCLDELRAWFNLHSIFSDIDNVIWLARILIVLI